MIIYTTLSIENRINKKYLEQVKNKQKELDEFKNNKNVKFRAHIYVESPKRIFHVNETGVFIEIDDELIHIPNVQSPNGRIYQTDPDFDKSLEEFIKKYPNYKITFDVDGRYGKTIIYIADQYIYPSIIESNGETLLLEDDDKYDIGCL